MNAVQVEADGEEFWGALLDRLSEVLTPQEEAAVRQVAGDKGSPSNTRQLHIHIAGLLVKHGLTTWSLLHTTFPEYYAGDAGALQEGLPAYSRAERGAREASVLAQDAMHSIETQGREHGQDNAACGADGARGESLDQQQPDVNTQGPLYDQDGSPIQLMREAEGSMEGAQEHVQPCSQKLEGGCDCGKRTTLADHSGIVDWWHPTKNGTNLPADYTPGSHKRVWLQCPGCPDCGEVHEWGATANTLPKHGRVIRCPSCSCKGGSFCSCRAISANERLAAEWHEDNPSPSTVSQWSHKRVKWRCADAACGHVWEIQPNNRSKAGGSNCPKCATRMRTQTKHPSVAVGRPDLSAEWDEEKNKSLATEVTLGTMKKVWWLCSKCGKSWEARVYVRAMLGRGCPNRCHMGK